MALFQATTEDPVPAAPAEALEATRSALQTELSSYLSRYFTVEQSACGVYSKDDTIFLTLTSENPNLRNYWSGKWSSTWRVKIDGDAKITGEIKVVILTLFSNSQALLADVKTFFEH